MKKDQSTEETILTAAKKVFLTRGMDGARMQDIADEAGIDKACYTTISEAKTNFICR